EVVMGLAKPVDAIVSHSRNSGVSATNRVDVIGSALGLEQLRSSERRVSDDDISGGPSNRISEFVDEGIRCREVIVQVVERKGFLRDVQFIDRQFSGNHHRDLGQFHGERVDVDAEKLASGHEPEHHLGGVQASRFLSHPLKLYFNSTNTSPCRDMTYVVFPDRRKSLATKNLRRLVPRIGRNSLLGNRLR